MNQLTRNILLFTVGLLLLTLTIEVWRHGNLDIEHPAAFFIAVMVLGIIGGYVITWVAEGKNR
jgi:hypothetical protein